MELVCPAGTLQVLRAAILAGADAIYCGFHNETNAGNPPGIYFTVNELIEGISFAHARGKKVRVAINTFGQAGRADLWRKRVDEAVACGVDAIITGDIAVVEHVAADHQVNLHLVIQAAAATPEPIDFYARTFGVRRIVLPRVLSIAEITALNRHINVETEAFIFGGFCMRIEGHCHLSSYAMRTPPKLSVVRFGPESVSHVEDHRDTPLCKDCFTVDGNMPCLFEDPTRWNVSKALAEMKSAGVTAVRIEGHQRDEGHITEVVRTFRRAFDAVEIGDDNIEIERELASILE